VIFIGNNILDEILTDFRILNRICRKRKKALINCSQWKLIIALSDTVTLIVVFGVGGVKSYTWVSPNLFETLFLYDVGR
jgi:hypothetical protein